MAVQTLEIVGAIGDGITPLTITMNLAAYGAAGVSPYTADSPITLTEDTGNLGVYRFSRTAGNSGTAGLFMGVDANGAFWHFLLAAVTDTYFGDLRRLSTSLLNTTGVMPANVTQWLGTAPLALSSQQVQSVVPSSTVVASVTGLTASNLDATVSSRASQLSLDTLDDYVDTEIAAIKAKTDQLVFTVANQVDANALSGGGSGLDAAQTRAALGLASANLDTQLGDLPTTAELSTALETADDATLAAIAALNNLSAAQVTAAVPTVAAIQSGLATIANQTTINNNVLAVPAAITSDHGAGSYIRNTEPETGLATAANLALVKVDTAAILLDTDSLDKTKLTTARAAALDLITAARMGALTDWIDGGRLDLILDTIAADTTTDIPALIAALPTAANVFTSVLTTALTESYAADGTPPTLAQAIMLIQQTLTEFAISGATTTVKKLDGITTAATLTLNSATTPTAVTRAT